MNACFAPSLLSLWPVEGREGIWRRPGTCPGVFVHAYRML